jgi:2-keto-4-pentenoate hydratase
MVRSSSDRAALTEHNRAEIAAALPTFALTLRRGREVIDVGVGANVLDSPALALVYLARVLAGQPQFRRSRRVK